MNSEQPNDVQLTETDRKPYQAPVFTTFGNIIDLTRTAIGTGTDGGGTGFSGSEV